MNQPTRQAHVGDAVIYHDPKGNPVNAIVNGVWWTMHPSSSSFLVNLIMVSTNEKEQDTYGRQMKRESSVHHVCESPVHGNYWRFPEESANEYIAPTES